LDGKEGEQVGVDVLAWEQKAGTLPGLSARWTEKEKELQARRNLSSLFFFSPSISRILAMDF